MTSMERYRKWYYANRDSNRAKKTEQMRRYRKVNPEKYARHSRDAKRKIRQAILGVFGRSCLICGFSDERALALDHILNNGAQERKDLGERGVYYRALKLENRNEYRMLCMNCQFIERHKVGRNNQHPPMLHSHGEPLCNQPTIKPLNQTEK